MGVVLPFHMDAGDKIQVIRFATGLYPLNHLAGFLPSLMFITAFFFLKEKKSVCQNMHVKTVFFFFVSWFVLFLFLVGWLCCCLFLHLLTR